ncbi:hypothetical protein JTB14_005312 [Gonioctena quinquepunctata]|nr:hypothetical protein JTB14_005312 [Gonioctena quinquepunctata]
MMYPREANGIIRKPAVHGKEISKFLEKWLQLDPNSYKMYFEKYRKSTKETEKPKARKSSKRAQKKPERTKVRISHSPSKRRRAQTRGTLRKTHAIRPRRRAKKGREMEKEELEYNLQENEERGETK